jgi:hypothetical protein
LRHIDAKSLLHAILCPLASRPAPVRPKDLVAAAAEANRNSGASRRFIALRQAQSGIALKMHL